MKKAYLIAAAVMFVLFLLHWSPWILFMEDGKPLSATIMDGNWGHYLGLERELWAALLAGAALACLGQGLCGSGCCQHKNDAYAP